MRKLDKSEKGIPAHATTETLATAAKEGALSEREKLRSAFYQALL